MKPLTVDAYFDIETEDWDQFALGGFLSQGRFELYTPKQHAAFANRVITHGGNVWGFNCGKFDTLDIVNEFIKAYTDEAKVILAGQRIVCLQIGETFIRDAAALTPMSLEKAAELGKVRKAKTGLPCVCKQDCGGYCSIKVNMSPAMRKKVAKYLEIDCRAGDSSLRSLFSYARKNEIILKSTIGASAWATAREWADLPTANWANAAGSDGRLYRFAREAYFGGRTQVIKPHSERGFHIDVNSAYVNALRVLELPIGRRKELGPSRSAAAFADGKDGVYEVEISIPESHIPPLPIRGRNRLYYPCGILRGVWTGIELRYAIECGGSIHRFNRSLVWQDSANIFRVFSERTWKLRDEAGPKTALGQWLKLFGNSATGKLAQNPLSETVEINVDVDPEDLVCPQPPCTALTCVLQGGDCCTHGCSGGCGRYVPLDEDDCIWSRRDWRMPACGHVHWAAYLTAYQRIYLHRQMMEGGGDDCVYVDTDSVFSERMRSKNIGNDLGDFKLDGACGKYQDFSALAPKTYIYTDIMKDGIYGPFPRHAKAKGFYAPDKNWEDIKAYRSVLQERGVLSIKSAIRDPRDGYFLRKSIERRLHIPERCALCGELHIGDRIVDRDTTRAQSIQSVMRHEKRG